MMTEFRTPIKLVDLAAQCRTIVLRAEAALGVRLTENQRLDLVADNLPDPSLSDLRAALVIAGLPPAPIFRNRGL